MRYRAFIVLYLLHKFRGERSVNGLYHLLNGKKSSQTIQDAKLYEVTFLFGMMSHLQIKDIHAVIAAFADDAWVDEKSEGCYILTEKGNGTLHEVLVATGFPSGLNGWMYGDAAAIVWKRMSLFIQSLSHLMHHNSHFYPVQRDPLVMDWVRAHFPAGEEDRVLTARKLYSELTSFLEQVSSVQADVFMKRFSGGHRTGETFEQIARVLNEEEDKIRMIFQSVLHSLLAAVKRDTSAFPLLQKFSNGLLNTWLTDSTAKTFQLIKQGKDIDQIQRIRRLKRGTIEDHLIELALHEPGFSIDDYISRVKQKKISEAIAETNARKLKPIKDRLGEKASYFEIRLVLARTGVGRDA